MRKTPIGGVCCLGRLPSPQDSARGHCAAGNKACDATGASSPARLSVHRVFSKRTAPRAARLSLSYLRLPSSSPLSLPIYPLCSLLDCKRVSLYGRYRFGTNQTAWPRFLFLSLREMTCIFQVSEMPVVKKVKYAVGGKVQRPARHVLGHAVALAVSICRDPVGGLLCGRIHHRDGGSGSCGRGWSSGGAWASGPSWACQPTTTLPPPHRYRP